VLLVNVGTLNNKIDSATLRFVFREAKIHNAIVFFDECELLFESRDQSSTVVPFLTELEKFQVCVVMIVIEFLIFVNLFFFFQGIAVLATNRPFDLDEAMYRRISVAIEFRVPDFSLRAKIWRGLIPVR
jgi:SpoVK/Ycf46/Vps4 family AAA+-type ATPase